VLALKNKITSASVGGISLRRGLVVTQFCISQVLIVGTLVAVAQMTFIQKADLGFRKDALLIINANTDSAAQARQFSFKKELLKLPGVEAVTFSSDVPSSDNNWTTNFAFDHRDDESYNLHMKFGDEDYLKTYGLVLAAGRSYTPSDTINEVLINETLVKKLGLKDPSQAVGKEIRMGRDAWRTIVGVTKDFKTNSLKEDIKPLIIAERKEYYSVTAVKLKSSNIRKTQEVVEGKWNETFPEYAYTTSYMDEKLAEFYEQESQLALLYRIFAVIAIIISCLGLYGLVSFMAVQKTKEIGVRKVLGASVGNIIYLFSREFTLLIIVASVIAIPVARYLMNKWLENFVFRIDISAIYYIAAVIITVLVAWIAVGYKSVKAALANPVKSIRTE
jgi:ABC-type antimicrobial peptide transport system permease subunit